MLVDPHLPVVRKTGAAPNRPPIRRLLSSVLTARILFRQPLFYRRPERGAFAFTMLEVAALSGRQNASVQRQCWFAVGPI